MLGFVNDKEVVGLRVRVFQVNNPTHGPLNELWDTVPGTCSASA